MDTQMEQAMKDAHECHKMCLKTLSHCLEMGGDHASKKHIQILIDCATMCETSLDFMGRESEFLADAAKMCGKVCEACAESCDALGGEKMKACAEACRKCAESCNALVLAHNKKENQNNI